MTKKQYMNAQVLTKFGAAKEAFQLQSIPIPTINEHQILIKVLASSVNPVDCKIRSGIYSAIAPVQPAVLHGDVVGMVVAVGAAVKTYKENDVVFGCAGGFLGSQGSLSEYMVVDPDLIALAPRKLSAQESAVLPLVGITAWLALIENTAIKPGQNVLIHGASGGVGSIAIQLAILKGANTFATASNDEKSQFAKHCGATVINYKTTDIDEYVAKYTDKQGFDLVFDTVGGDNLVNSIKALKKNGRICSIAPSSSVDLVPLYKLGGSLNYIFMPHPLLNINATHERKMYGNILNDISKLVDDGKIKPLIGASFNFSEVAKAHELQETNNKLGKISLVQDLDVISGDVIKRK